MPETDGKEKAMKFAEKLIGLRRRSEFEMRKKLSEKKFNKGIVEEVLEELRNFGYINDAKFAESYINDRINLRPAGKFLIKMELKSRGVNEKIINNKLDEMIDRYKEVEMAEKLIKKRMDGLNPKESRKDKIKLVNFLKMRGFSADVISQAMENKIK